MSKALSLRQRKAPCYGCQKRQLGCHSTCEEYLSFKAKTEAARGEKYTENEIRTHEFEARRRMQKNE